MIEVTIPYRLQSVANISECWQKKSARVKRERGLIRAFIRPSLNRSEIRLPVLLTLTRISPRFLDKEDNLPASWKSLKDSLAELFFPDLARGRADDSDQLRWLYVQEKGAPKYYAIKIRIENAGSL